jgi:riboflavin kinase/FMN adenylyltransferase
MNPIKIFNGITTYKIQPKPLVLAMGMFDGVHLGHQKVISEAKAIAEKIDGTVFALTFDTHPKKLLTQNSDFGVLTTNDEKIEILAKMDIDGILFLYFDKQTSEMDPEKFVKNELIKKLNINHLVVGEDFRFGKAQKGDVLLLKNLAEKYSFAVKSVENINFNSPLNESLKISSTLIKQELLAGNLELANLNLGYDFFIKSRVIKGLQIARKFSIPTANLHIPAGKILPHGVFAGITEWKNKNYPSIISVGNRQTLENHNQLCLETHILDFKDEIYGDELKVSFVKKIRDQQKFESLDFLFAQVQEDIKKVIRYFK